MAGCNYRKVLTSIVGFLAYGMSNIAACANVFALAFKAKFHLTQTELENLLSLFAVGLIATMPTGLLVRWKGPRVAAAIALPLTTLSYLLLWSATLTPDFYYDKYYLLVVYFLLAGFGNGITMVSSISAVMQYYHHKNTGTSLGQLDSGQSLFPLIFIFLYNQFFADGHYEDPINQNLGGFLLLIAVCFAIFNLCGIFFYFPLEDSGRAIQSDDWCVLGDDISLSQDKFYISNDFYMRDKELPSPNGLVELKEDSPVLGTVSPKLKIYHSESSDTSDGGTQNIQMDSTPNLCKLLSYGRFWCIGLGSMMISGLVTMHINNLTTYLAAFNLDEYAAVIPYINPIFGFLCKNIIGFVSDRLEKWVAKPWWLIGVYIAFAAISVLAIFYLNTIAFITIFYITIDASGSICAVITQNLLITYFGIDAFPVGFGFVRGMTALTVIIFQYVFGVMYDTQITDGSTTSCYGFHCFTNSLVMSALVCIAALLLSLYLLFDYYSCACCPTKKHVSLEQSHK